MAKELAKSYNPQEVEDRIYKFWQDGDFFHAEIDHEKKPYTIMMPPPNITGQLHMGHALDETLQDILIRFKRMQGYSALWLPGTDHASIATETKIVEALRKEGVSKEEIGREGFLKRAWEWKKEYGGTITSQLKKLGSSCDWARERFTLDDGCSKAVREVFIRLYEKKLIYRGERIINWCPECRTSISDAEVVFEEEEGFFWHLRYPLADDTGFLELATTRPETLLGDTAVAVHPDDERYKNFVGKTVILPLVGREIPVVADNYVEPDFGTGVVKITPAHDPNDFEVGLRHNLPVINVMTESAVMNGEAGKYEGMDRYEARKEIVKDLESGGFLVKREAIKHNVGSCYRCHTTVEPRVSKQWFVKMKPLAEPAMDCVRSGKTKFVPERFDKIFFHWMENIKDWCISRQLWWGHRIPAWYCQGCGETVVAKETPTVCPKCGGTSLVQDPDTLDTWFSSALWPFSTLGWPDKTPELEYFYPTDTLVTGYDIIFFWVSRMIFSAVENTGSQPFDTVLIHGLVRDANGIKMSKSLGNGIDPLAVIDKYGADALRFFLVAGNSPGNDMRYIPEKVEASSNFANKLWNAARFIHMHIDGCDVKDSLPKVLETEDKWIISKFNDLAGEVTDNLEKFELGVAVSKLYNFIWDCFCDWYIELAKTRLQTEAGNVDSVRRVLVWVMNGALKLLHPVMPFITEEIWQSLPHGGNEKTIMLCKYPEYRDELSFPEAAREMELVMDTIKAIRVRRNEMNVAPSKKAKVYIAAKEHMPFENGAKFIERLAFASEVMVGDEFATDGAVTIVTADARIYIPMSDLVDMDAERARLEKELAHAKSELELNEKKLNNQGFMSKAPEKVVAGVRANAYKYTEQIKQLTETLKNM